MSYTQHRQRRNKTRTPKTNYKGALTVAAIALLLMAIIAPKLVGVLLLTPFVLIAAMVIGGGMSLMFGSADVFMAFFGRIFRDR